MIRGKNGFWLLIIIFSLIAILVVLNGENTGEIVSGMDGSMGQMMKKDHAAGSSLSELFNTAWSHQSQSMAGQHSVPPLLKSIDLVGSAAMLTVLPLIIGATTLMIILWI